MAASHPVREVERQLEVAARNERNLDRYQFKLWAVDEFDAPADWRTPDEVERYVRMMARRLEPRA